MKCFVQPFSKLTYRSFFAVYADNLISLNIFHKVFS